MLQVGKIKIRNIKELQDSEVVTPRNAITPLKKRKNLISAATSKCLKDDFDNEAVRGNNRATTTTKTPRTRLIKSALKETLPNQKRIDSYFTSCPKSYDIKLPKEELAATTYAKAKPHKIKGKGSTTTNKQSSGRLKSRRKRLFSDSTELSTENMSDTSYMKVHKKQDVVECITIDSSDSEEENNVNTNISSSKHDSVVNKGASEPASSSSKETKASSVNANSSPNTTASSLSFGLQLTKTSCEITKSTEKSSTTTTTGGGRRKTKPCPPYKIIENTTFAVDAFQFGYIDNVTHYFLTHFHADHYIGLTKSFAMPIFVSPVTARLLRSFIPVQEQYINELDLNQTVVVNNIEITALDANHCPGSIMFVFKFLDTGKCVLHTGDFRASHDMESEPIFWNNHIHTIYLDTTYISDKYAFCTQYESIEKAHDLIEKFLAKRCGHRVLYICGSYVIGKERFWSSLAEDLDIKVWTERNRSKALQAINDERFNRLLVEDPNEADMHILPMKKLSYLELVEYFKQYEHKYDALFALRPSGWEKDTKPRYGSKINVVGVEYSEHSSYAEMQRFVKFLKPDQVISTVSSGRDLMKTSSVPQSWYKYDKLNVSSNYQPTIDSFLGKTPQKKLRIRLPNASKGGVEHFVSPFKSHTPKHCTELNISAQPSQPAQITDSMEEVCAEKFPTIAQNERHVGKTKLITLAKSITNSSDDFEKCDFIIKTKTTQGSKKNVKEKHNHKGVTKTKQKRNQKQSEPRNICAQDDKTKFEAFSQISNNKLKREKKSQIETSQLQISSDKELNTFPATPVHKRITRSQKNSSMLTNNSSETKPNHSAPQSSGATSQKKSKTNSINSTPDAKTTPFVVESPPNSPKRATRSKAASAKTSNSHNTRHNNNNNSKEFESNLLKVTEKNNIESSFKPKSQLKSSKTVDSLKSINDSAVDRLSLRDNNYNSIKPLTRSENFLDDFEQLPAKSSNNKRHALNRDLTPLKKTKSTFNTQTILNTILEQSDNIDRFQCSQLAGLVVETVNQRNPDNTTDHIPADLLSDADDDWM